MVWGAVVKPFKRWHNLLAGISGPPTFKAAWARESPVGGALKGGGVFGVLARSSTCGGVTWCRDLWACLAVVSRGGWRSVEKFWNSRVGYPVQHGRWGREQDCSEAERNSVQGSESCKVEYLEQVMRANAYGGHVLVYLYLV